MRDDRIPKVTESSRANVAADVDGVLCTPPVSCGLLAGLGVFLYGLLCATYLVMSCSGWLLTVHALAADAPPAQNAGSKRRRHPSENAGLLDHRSGHVAAPLAGLYP